MASKPLQGEATHPPPPPSSSSSFSENWKERILIPTILAGIGGGGVGLVSKHRQTHGLASISTAYATNFAIVTGCYCGAREFVRVSRKSEPDDLVNSAFAGFGTGALLGRLQGGQFGAFRYSIIFAVVGTTVDFATIKLKPKLRSFKQSLYGDKEKKGGWLKLPVWFPIQVLDEEALAAKEVREKQLYEQRMQRALGKLSKEES
ncbi:uncharacterized protein LOC8279040 [Ricinus communis]|uniref:Protein translocase, putative n=1 Tax=Ricinus communis TaxID=3988 RepID=B9T3B8_RICCO|nr:uncharacterized protein LOC8279040 [Ricinus communis]EEF29639.1 protein translocase, putative [Ricinus communis]|eukprot:XP_002532737.1 uncharacterized protein LOC8279040 [Ricinus communis]